jgi:hypothetical protein
VTARATQILILSWLLGFSLSCLSAVVALCQSSSASNGAQDQTPSAAFAGYVFLLVLSLVAALLGMRSAALEPLRIGARELGLRRGSCSTRRAAAAAVVYVGVLGAAISVTVTLLDWCGVHGSGASSGINPEPGVLPVELFHASVAGLGEEPVMLALPMALARRVRWPWAITIVVMIAMRISFHVYYGWDSLFVLPWIMCAYFLYRWCPLLWPFVIGHGLFDLLQTLQTYGSTTTAWATGFALDAVCVAGVVLALVVVVRHMSERREVLA